MTQREPRAARGDDIDAHLKRAFQQITEEALPDRFADLLQRLKTGDGAGKAAKAGKAEAGDDARETTDATDTKGEQGTE